MKVNAHMFRRPDGTRHQGTNRISLAVWGPTTAPVSARSA